MKAIASIDDKLVDGLRFCRKVYDAFDALSAAPEGIKRLRLRSGHIEKRIVEELVPLARFVQENYSAGRRIKVRWKSGNQNIDACLTSSGWYINQGYTSSRQYVEITTAVHPDAHLSKAYLTEHGFSGGPGSVRRDKKSRKLILDSSAQGLTAEQFSDIVIQRIKDKRLKGFPKNTALIINCELGAIYYDEEWEVLLEKVTACPDRHYFQEVFLWASIRELKASLYQNKAEAKKIRRLKNFS